MGNSDKFIMAIIVYLIGIGWMAMGIAGKYSADSAFMFVGFILMLSAIAGGMLWYLDSGDIHNEY